MWRLLEVTLATTIQTNPERVSNVKFWNLNIFKLECSKFHWWMYAFQNYAKKCLLFVAVSYWLTWAINALNPQNILEDHNVNTNVMAKVSTE